MVSVHARVFVIDDHPLIQTALRALLDASSEFDFVGCASTEAEALDAMVGAKMDVVILDLSLGQAGGLDLLQRLHALRPGLRVLVFSMHPDHAMAELALKAGALGYLMKDAPGSELLAALRAVRRGEVYVRPQIQQQLLHHHHIVRHLDVLTPREQSILHLFGEEENIGKLAERLNISRKTVETHLRRIREKLDLADLDALRTEARRLHF